MLDEAALEWNLDAERFEREVIYQLLAGYSGGLPNGEELARMIASWYAGEGAMPPRLGLTRKAYRALLDRHFPGCPLPHKHFEEPDMDLERLPETQDLRDLLLANRVDEHPEREWIADILVAGCLGNDHLWQDLGLWTRGDVSALIECNFPALKARNVHDMKWKKFLYKQLCLSESIYVCRAPSCAVCNDYQHCFGPEN